jgi:cytochrome c peroxidase
MGRIWLFASVAALVGACAPEESGSIEDVGIDPLALGGVTPDCNPDELSGGEATLCETTRRLEGRRLFDKEEFGGNGRTCLTCHSKTTGTISPADVQARVNNPHDPLFVHDGLDDDGVGTTRIEADATIRVRIPLPPYVTLADDPTATHIEVFRGVPTTLNTPALDPVLMLDGRAATLEAQALGAIHDHAQNTVEPTDNELELIAEFQEEAPRFFSSPVLRNFANGGPPPELPEGNTASEQRGRLFFVDAPFDPPSKVGVCGLCHSGPMLNETNIFGTQVFPAPLGARFHPIQVEVVNRNNYPVYDLLVDDGLGNIVPVSTPDPGMLLTPHLLPPPQVLPRTAFVGFFKTPQLWGLEKTAPYFHDNSVKTLEEVVDQYQFFFDNDPFTAGSGIVFTEQDKQDLVAFMKLL